MKKIKLFGIVFSLILITNCKAQNDEESQIRTIITAFAKAGDVNDAKKLETYLDDNYRIVMNRMFGSDEVNVISRAVYLDKIPSKEFGGDPRVLTIENVVLNGTTASAKVIFKGTKSSFVSLLGLVKNAGGDWKLISDMAVVQ